MNRVRAIRRTASILTGLAAGLLILATAAPAALASPWPPSVTPTAPATMRPPLPGWNKHPPLPAHLRPLAAGSIPGWQLTLMALTVLLFVATLVAIAYPGPGRPAAGERTDRRSDDRIRRRAEPHGQPAALARPTPADRPCCLSCCQWLDHSRYQVIPFDSHGDTGRSR